MSKIFRFALAFIFLSISASSGASDDFIEAIDSYIRQRTLPVKFSGNVLVARQQNVIFHKSYGMADYENDIPNSADTVFRIGSLTKPITAVSVLVLQKQSRLSVHDSIETYLANIPEEWRKVKIHHLLSHSSGIPDLFGDLDDVPVENTVKEIDRVIRNTEHRSLEFEPGTKYAYKNFNYCLLGYICEKVSGQDYPSFLQTNIFEISAMHHTFYDDPRPIIKKRAQGYVAKDGQLRNDKLTDPAGYAAGGLLSTTEDLFRFDQALHSGKLISADGVSSTFTPVHENYGYGWQITKQFNRRAFNHRGGTHGFSSYMVRYPDNDNLFIVVLSNVEEQSTRAVACDIAALYFGLPQARIHRGSSGEGDWEDYAGDYQLGTGDMRTIQMKSGSLYYKSGNTELKLLPVSSDEFIFQDAEELHLKFLKNADGSLEMVRTSCGQEEMRGKKQ